jgi:hypothetical protein
MQTQMQTQRAGQAGRPALMGQMRAPLPVQSGARGGAGALATRPALPSRAPLPSRPSAAGAKSGTVIVASRSQSTGALPSAQRSSLVGGGSAQPASYSQSTAKGPGGRSPLPQRPGAVPAQETASVSLGVMKRDGAQLTVYGCQRQGGDVACDTEYGNLDQSHTQITSDGWKTLYAIDGDGNKYSFASALLETSDGQTRDNADVLYGHAMRYVIYFSGVPTGVATFSLVQPGDNAQSVADVAVQDEAAAAAPDDGTTAGGSTDQGASAGADDGSDSDKKATDSGSSKSKSTGAKLKKVAKDAVKEAVRDATEAVLGDDGDSGAAKKK